jgi:DnaK suppressor protein
MSAKRPAPKSGKGKAVDRSAARKPAARKPAERVKAAAHARKTVTQPKKASAHRSAATESPASTARKPAPDAHKHAQTARKPESAGEGGHKAAEDAPAAESAPTPKPAAPARAAQPPAHSTSSTKRAASPPASPDGEDNDSAEPGSLLAGPRNVQPYIAKRGEQYMSKEQLDHFRQILSSWKQDLMMEVDRTVTHMKDEAANFPDPNDRATQEEEFSLELRTRDRERKLIRKIDEAIKRIEDGSYGYCLETGEEIGIKRLEARPVATLSIEAQERRERRERQYGDRDDRYR